MFDIEFYQNSFTLKIDILSGAYNTDSAETLFNKVEKFRKSEPTLFNLETTNNCNMKCVMCPRTTMMTRDIKSMSLETYNKVLDQIAAHSPEDLQKFWKFIESTHKLSPELKNENTFYFYIVSRCLTLHGYGEPLLDKSLVDRVKSATSREIPTYLSCVPANLTVAKAEELMKAGLTVLKVSIDALSDMDQKKIRGSRNNFNQAFETVLKILELKEKKGYSTIIAPTMIAFSHSEQHIEEQQRFLDLWKNHDVFAYVKSQDNRWLYEEDSTMENYSHYESQYCEYPWTSLTILADGNVVPCTQDYNGELSFGNIHQNSLEEIWNGPKYKEFRMQHISGNFPPGHKCLERCDQKKIKDYLKNAES